MPAEESENMVLRTMYLPKALDAKLRALAFTLDMSKAQFMRTLLQEALNAREGKGQQSLAQAARNAVITAKSPIKGAVVPTPGKTAAKATGGKAKTVTQKLAAPASVREPELA